MRSAYKNVLPKKIANGKIQTVARNLTRLIKKIRAQLTRWIKTFLTQWTQPAKKIALDDPMT